MLFAWWSAFEQIFVMIGQTVWLWADLGYAYRQGSLVDCSRVADVNEPINAPVVYQGSLWMWAKPGTGVAHVFLYPVRLYFVIITSWLPHLPHGSV